MNKGRRKAKEEIQKESPVSNGELEKVFDILKCDASIFHFLLNNEVFCLLFRFVALFDLDLQLSFFLFGFSCRFFFLLGSEFGACLSLFYRVIECFQNFFNIKASLRYGFVVSKRMLFSIFDDQDLWTLLQKLQLMGNQYNQFGFEMVENTFIENVGSHLWVYSAKWVIQ